MAVVETEEVAKEETTEMAEITETAETTETTVEVTDRTEATATDLAVVAVEVVAEEAESAMEGKTVIAESSDLVMRPRLIRIEKVTEKPASTQMVAMIRPSPRLFAPSALTFFANFVLATCTT